MSNFLFESKQLETPVSLKQFNYNSIDASKFEK